ncbi:methylenetetrahydrofolate reductase [Trichuris trichiura]|uniref:Methylenetetrahydrofolate reductase n=1 Tax=Trichuris trichiura TaxID=36087 RepID=A0A077ZEP2_TRITR|nr:methylenetetrahydrofolate reductase [Trichuris trichiura]
MSLFNNNEVSIDGSASVEPLRPLRERIDHLIKAGDVFFSLEFFPPHSEVGLRNLYRKIERFAEVGPLFVDITWSVRRDSAGDQPNSSISVARSFRNLFLLDVVVHLTCVNCTTSQLESYVDKIKNTGIRNIVALRGDTTSKPTLSSMKYANAVQLVQLLRFKHGDYFTIAVAGYPLGHSEAVSFNEDLKFLKRKVDEGADFIITQFFFSSKSYFHFVKRCRDIGITVPIIPGIMPVHDFEAFKKTCSMCGQVTPTWMCQMFEPIQENAEAVKNLGIHLAVQMCQELLGHSSYRAPSLHFYTLNQEEPTRTILKQIGMWQSIDRSILPWKVNPTQAIRRSERVRPIYWKNRPKAYIFRTKHWILYPDASWLYRSDIQLSDLDGYELFDSLRVVSRKRLLEMWGPNLHTMDDINAIFFSVVSGRPNVNGAIVEYFPWSESKLKWPILPQPINDDLLWCASNGILLINWQAAVNKAPSGTVDIDDPSFGWGELGGHVFQKAYLEFFASAAFVHSLLSIIPKYPMVSYHVLNRDASFEKTNAAPSMVDANVVTWGIFHDNRCVQPYVTHPMAFRQWKDEAFNQWKMWEDLYEARSPEHALFSQIYDQYSLVSLVDNDYKNPTSLFDLLKEAISEPVKFSVYALLINFF